MNEEMQTTGYTGADAATGPTAGYDPVPVSYTHLTLPTT